MTRTPPPRTAPRSTVPPSARPLPRLAADVDEIVDATAAVVAGFADDYWRDHCRSHRRPRRLWDALAVADLLAVGVPEHLGGVGGGLTQVAAVVEALARAGMPLFSLLTTHICRELLVHHGTDEQRAAHVAATVAGDRVFAFAITEPDAGTNTFAIRTVARATAAGGYRLNGQKVFISGIDEADLVVVVARTQRRDEVDDRRAGMALLLVDPRAPGVHLTPMDIAMPAPERQFHVWFDDVEVADSDVVGAPGRAFDCLFTVLNPERLLSAATQVGIGYLALDRGVARAWERTPFGVPVGTYQAIQHPLAHARAALDAARLLIYHGCRRYDEGRPAAGESNAAKLLAGEAAHEALDAAVQVHGGGAFDASAGLVELWPLVRMGRVGPVSNEMVLNFIGEHVLGLPKSY